MPAVGKSTAGVLLAKRTARAFIDTDVGIQTVAGRSLQEIIERDGIEAFRCLEERYVLALDCRATVIATGGSVVYSAAAMEHLGSLGVIVHLRLELGALERRLADFASRGIVRRPGQTLAELYAERMPLYERYANVAIDCTGREPAGVVAAIEEALAGIP